MSGLGFALCSIQTSEVHGMLYFKKKKMQGMQGRDQEKVDGAKVQ